MAWGASRSFPRAIVHIDGDAFFAACEVAKNPKLRGKPVITGKERGIVSAATYEAKRLGITRGMRLFEVRKMCPEAVILPSDYETYSLFSQRMYAIMRRYTPVVEEYGIDECFGDITGLRRLHRMPYEHIARRIKDDSERELNLSFSLGLGPTKVLAKLGSKWHKPSGFTVIRLSDAPKFLRQTKLEQLWGIGANTAAYLQKFGLTTALDFANKDEAWVKQTVSKPYYEMWQELHGTAVYSLETEAKETYASISKTKTFTPPSSGASFVFSQLSKNIENACIKARRYNLAAPAALIFLKTQEFQYHTCEVTLPHASNLPQEVLRAVSEYFPRLYKKGVPYRATGVTLLKLQDAGSMQLDLFGEGKKAEGLQKVYASIDALTKRYGKHALFLGSSVTAMRYGAHRGERGEAPGRVEDLFTGETNRKRLSIPMLGEAT